MTVLAVFATCLASFFQVTRSFDPVANPWVEDKKYQPTNRSHTWCKIARGMWRQHASNLSLDLPHALRGRNVSLVMERRPIDDPFFAYDSVHQRVVGGYLAEVVEELARRTGFSWQQSFAVVEPSGPEGYDAWLNWATDNYDVVIGAFAITPHRRAESIRFGFPMQSSSPTLITKLVLRHPSLEDTFNTLFAWCRPFSFPVWATFVCAMVLTSTVYQYLEDGDKDFHASNFGDHFNFAADKGLKGKAERHFHALFLTVGQFTKAARPAPLSRFGKILAIAWSFTCLLVGSMYTANLASLLVVTPVPQGSVNGIEDAIANDLPVCIWKGGAFDGLLQDLYPRLRIKYPENFGYEALRDGTCVGLVKDYSMWQVDRGLRKCNGPCDLVAVAEPLADMQSGFASKMDDAVSCRDLVMDVISYAMSDMHSDGWFQEHRRNFLRDAHDHTCEIDDVKAHSFQRLELCQVGGMFVNYGLVVVGCIMCHLLWGYTCGRCCDI